MIRTLIIMSVWYNNRTQRVCNMYASEANLLFVIKCILKINPYTLVFSAMSISVFYFGFAIRICESPLQRDKDNQLFHNMLNSMWNIIITMTTVGYGDYFAQTHLGRFVIFFVCMWGVFIVSMMVITLNNTLETSNLENKAIVVVQRLQIKNEMKQYAAFVLTSTIKTYLLNRKQQLTKDFKKQFQIKLRFYLHQLKIAQRQYRDMTDENLTEEMLDLQKVQKKISQVKSYKIISEILPK
ncbi:small-conductance calcium-activated potassium channel protein, putative [Ichthyophthirius multifiliis]|uniref:Small-conductance calcium-activated potassium channel protein, putative n=1 Tax=Ichthyophthirius multifiliis TaxID=5932 RepID=G0R1D5_ICHMU|nr:small-conductance calcium-activated potassium channel protein, putative [Ichthyophthirius multifiliis]EGR28720.1 small-conductance calcium-activated potassium channel protein, putative [Ichthyophthirius multifiliis]|eukprot:XP_004029956.1 small-conductance calcium-activated potassium channel protein, putative [Ichthyophthirius multifiliis]